MKNIVTPQLSEVTLFLRYVSLQHLGIFGSKRRKNILAEVEIECQPPLFHEKETSWVTSQTKSYVPCLR